MMTAAAARAFDVVVVEALDRVSRDMADLATIFKLLRFAGISLVAVHDGIADEVAIGVRGLVGALYLSDLPQTAGVSPGTGSDQVASQPRMTQSGYHQPHAEGCAVAAGHGGDVHGRIESAEQHSDHFVVGVKRGQSDGRRAVDPRLVITHEKGRPAPSKELHVQHLLVEACRGSPVGDDQRADLDGRAHRHGLADRESGTVGATFVTLPAAGPNRAQPTKGRSPLPVPRRATMRRRRATIAAVLILGAMVIVVLALPGGLHQPPGRATRSAGPPPSATLSTAPPPRGTTTTVPPPHVFAVGETRLVASNGDRSLPTMVRYPAVTAGAHAPPERAGGPFPLIVFSQGFDIESEAYAGLLEQWTAAGYVVADPAYPFTSPDSPGGPIETDIVRHPKDLSSVITALLQSSRTSNGLLTATIDTSRVGVAGHSDGGDVTEAVAADTCCRDQRVTAAAVLSGAELTNLGGSYTAGQGLPMLVTQGSADAINVPACSQQIYNRATLPRYYLDLIGAGHHSPYLAAGPYEASPTQAARYQGVVDRVTVDFWNAFLKRAPGARQAITNDGTAAGVSAITTGPPLSAHGSCPGAPLP